MPLRVLVVDDCPDTRATRRILLRLWGHHPREAAGFGQEADVECCREAGFNDHLLKPFDPEVLKSLLGRHGGPAAGPPP